MTELELFFSLFMVWLAICGITFYRPLIGLFIVIAALPLPVQRIKWLYPGDFVFFPVLAGWLLYVLFRYKGDIGGKKVIIFFLPFLLIALCSKVYAGSIFQFKGDFYLWSSVPAAYLFSLNAIETKNDFFEVIYLILVSAAIFALLYIANHFFLSSYSIVVRSRVIDFYFNSVATYLGLVLFLCLGMMVFEKKRNKIIMFSAGFSLILAALFFTGSRWGIATSLAGLLWFIIFCLPKERIQAKKNLLILILCTSIFIFLAMYFFDYVLFQRIFSWDGKSFQERLNIWQAGCLLFKHNPYLGIGMGWYNYYTYYSHLHNIILQVLSETGLLGLGAFLFLIGALIIHGRRLAKRLSRQSLYIFCSIAAAFLFFGMRNMFDFTLDRGLGIFLGIMLALLEKVPEN